MSTLVSEGNYKLLESWWLWATLCTPVVLGTQFALTMGQAMLSPNALVKALPGLSALEAPVLPSPVGSCWVGN